MSKTFIDWVKFRCKNDPFQIFNSFRYSSAFWGGDGLTLSEQEKGRDGWQFRRVIYLTDYRIASIDYGGDSQLGWVRVDMSGSGCRWVKNWEAFANVLASLESADLRRVDIALDIYDGADYFNKAKQSRLDGGFDRGGRRPLQSQVISSDVKKGWTLYFGARESSRYVRIYAKGWEILEKASVLSLPLPAGFDLTKNPITWECGNVCAAPDYVRMEVEIKAVDGFILPFAMLYESDSHFAAVGSFMASHVDAAPERLSSIPSAFAAKLKMESLIAHCSKSYGGVLRAALAVYGDTPETRLKLFNDILSAEPSNRLVELGILTI